MNKIAKGIKILKNIGTLGLRNKLAPEGSVLPNSLIHLILILLKQYLVSIGSSFIPFILEYFHFLKDLFDFYFSLFCRLYLRYKGKI